MLYRYQEKDSGFGIFRIMDDIIVNPAIINSLTKKIDSILPVPPFDIFIKYNTRSFFTEKSIELFKNELDRIVKRFEYDDFEVEIITCNEEDVKNYIVYADEYQVLIEKNKYIIN